MAEVQISKAARIDIEDIRADGTDHFGEEAAERHLHDIRRIFTLLAEHPFAGQGRPELLEGIRTMSMPPHRILYSVTGDVVLIVRVIHQARDVQAVLGTRQ